MDWIAQNKWLIWQGAAAVLLALELVVRCGGGGLLRRLAPFVAAAALGTLALHGGEPVAETSGALGAMAVLLLLHGLAGLGGPPASTGDQRGDSLVPAGLACGAVLAEDLSLAVGCLAAGQLWLALASRAGDPLGPALRWIDGVARSRADRGADPRSGVLTRAALRPALLAAVSGLVVLGLGLYGVSSRVSAGGTGVVEWLGLPFRGDAAASAVFAALLLPLVLPGGLGGATSALAAGPHADGEAGRHHGWATGAVLIGWLQVVQVLFGGVEALRWAGLAALVAALAAGAGPRRLVARRHGALLQGAAGLALFGAGTGDEAAADALTLWLFALAGAGAVVGLSVARATRAPRSEGETLARAMPQTTLFTWVAVLALLGAPFTVGGTASSIGLGAAAIDGAMDLAQVVLGASGLLIALVGAPLLIDLFHSPPDEPREGTAEGGSLVLTAAAALGAGFVVSCGLVPGALQRFLPHPRATLTGFPGLGLSVGIVVVGLAVGMLLHRKLRG